MEWRCVGGVESGGRGGGEFGKGCVWGGAGEQDWLGAFPQLLDTMLPDVCSKHVLVCMVKVYMSCVVSTPQTPVTSSSGPTRVPVRDLRWPLFLCMTKTTVI